MLSVELAITPSRAHERAQTRTPHTPRETQADTHTRTRQQVVHMGEPKRVCAHPRADATRRSRPPPSLKTAMPDLPPSPSLRVHTRTCMAQHGRGASAHNAHPQPTAERSAGSAQQRAVHARAHACSCAARTTVATLPTRAHSRPTEPKSRIVTAAAASMRSMLRRPRPRSRAHPPLCCPHETRTPAKRPHPLPPTRNPTRPQTPQPPRPLWETPPRTPPTE